MREREIMSMVVGWFIGAVMVLFFVTWVDARNPQQHRLDRAYAALLEAQGVNRGCHSLLRKEREQRLTLTEQLEHLSKEPK